MIAPIALKRLVAGIFLCLLAINLSAQPAPPISMQKPKYYQLRVQCNIVAYTVMLNGVPIGEFEGRTSHFRTNQANQWLVPGNNKLEVRYSFPEGVERNPGDAHIEVKFIEAVDGNTPGEELETLLVDFQWRDDGAEPMPQIFRQSISLPEFPETTFSKLEPIGEELTQKDRYAILAKVIAQINAFINQDIDQYTAMTTPAFADICRSRYKSAEYIKSVTEAAAEQVRSLSGIRYIEPDKPFRFELCCDNKLVHILLDRADDSNTDALKFTHVEDNEEQQISMDLYYAKIDGDWVQIR